MNAEEAYQFENSGFIVLRKCLEPELVGSGPSALPCPHPHQPAP